MPELQDYEPIEILKYCMRSLAMQNQYIEAANVAAIVLNYSLEVGIPVAPTRKKSLQKSK